MPLSVAPAGNVLGPFIGVQSLSIIKKKTPPPAELLLLTDEDTVPQTYCLLYYNLTAAVLHTSSTLQHIFTCYETQTTSECTRWPTPLSQRQGQPAVNKEIKMMSRGKKSIHTHTYKKTQPKRARRTHGRMDGRALRAASQRRKPTGHVSRVFILGVSGYLLWRYPGIYPSHDQSN